MGLEPTTLCLGRLGLIIRSSGLFLNLATHHSPIEADGRQIANRRYYTPNGGQFKPIHWPGESQPSRILVRSSRETPFASPQRSR